MKLLKKLAVALAALVVLSVPLSSASAAQGIGVNEQLILDALNQPITLSDGRVVYVPAQHVNQVRNLLISTDVSADQANQIIGYISQAIANVESSNYTSFAEASQGAVNQVVALIERAAAVLGLTISIDFGSGNLATDINVSILSATGNVVGESRRPVRATGNVLTGVTWVAVGTVGVLAACTLVAKKKNLTTA